MATMTITKQDVVTKVFSGSFTLQNSVTVLVPNRDKEGNVVDSVLHSSIVDAVSRELAKVAGGSTVKEGHTGFYYTTEGRLIKEDTTEIQAFCSDADFEKVLIKARELADEVKEVISQECVAVVVNNEFHMV